MLLPPDFQRLMLQHYGEVQAHSLFQALTDTEPDVSVRLNAAKCNRLPSCILPSGSHPVPWCDGAYYLPQRPAFTFDPLFHGGAYYVQDASSMYLAQALRQHFLPHFDSSSAPAVLDLCAAPGGKSTLLRSILPDGAFLLCNEPVAKRTQILVENMAKWGHPNVAVTHNYPADFSPLSHTFDLIVADVPCSGEGMFRKDEQAVSEWSLQNVETCRLRQREIIRSVWPCLKPGGLLVYSTCTFNRYEDEENARWIMEELGADNLPLKADPSWGIVEGNPGCHFFPGQVRGEGFYIAVLRKSDAEPLRPAVLKERKSARKKTQAPALSSQLLASLPSDFLHQAEADVCYGVSKKHVSLVTLLSHHLQLWSKGVHVAQLKGRDWQPAHSLSQTLVLQAESYPQAELTYEQALAYLRHENIVVQAPRGFVLVTYRQLPLGFVKNLGNRANNLYPQEWRIRSPHTTPFQLFEM